MDRAILPLAAEMPTARFHENERPNFLPIAPLLSHPQLAPSPEDPTIEAT